MNTNEIQSKNQIALIGRCITFIGQRPMNVMQRPMNGPIKYNTTKKLKLLSLILSISLLFSACGVYTFKDVSIPPEIKTIKLGFIENKARYINPQLSPRLNDRLQQKIVGQTHLTRTTNDDADYVIIGWISDYSVSLSGISGQQASTNRLTVGVHLVLKNNKAAKEDAYDVSKSFEFPGSKSISQVETTLTDEIVRGISDEIFNRLFSNW